MNQYYNSEDLGNGYKYYVSFRYASFCKHIFIENFSKMSIHILNEKKNLIKTAYKAIYDKIV